MRSVIYKEDKGLDFGRWNDNVSRFMYWDCMPDILEGITIPQRVADYGGANGNIKRFIPHALSIDIDESKNPDIHDDILTHSERYDLVVIRYVLHYLTDKEVLQLFDKINAKEILVIQFVNDDLRSKYVNSIRESKHFRTQSQLEGLLPDKSELIYSSEYQIDSKFYENRLGAGEYVSHYETLNAYHVYKH